MSNLNDFDGDIGTCITCHYEDELDNAGKCTGCTPPSRETTDALKSMVRPIVVSIVQEAS